MPPTNGFRDSPAPADQSGLDAAKISADLRRRGQGIEVQCHEAVGSTQDVARQAVGDGSSRPVLVVTRRQSDGRGRRGRRWVHTPGGLAFTLAVQLPSDAPAAWPTMATAIAAAHAVESHTGVALGIKWPNDLVHRGRKVGGVLAEAHGPWTLVGVGLNVNAAPGVADGTPTAAIAELAGGAIDDAALLTEVVSAMVSALLADPAARRRLHQDWNELSVVRDAWVIVNGPDGHVYGRAEALPADGSLHLVLGDGTRRVIRTGDVSLRLDRSR